MRKVEFDAYSSAPLSEKERKYFANVERQAKETNFFELVFSQEKYERIHTNLYRSNLGHSIKVVFEDGVWLYRNLDFKPDHGSLLAFVANRMVSDTEVCILDLKEHNGQKMAVASVADALMKKAKRILKRQLKMAQATENGKLRRKM